MICFHNVIFCAGWGLVIAWLTMLFSVNVKSRRALSRSGVSGNTQRHPVFEGVQLVAGMPVWFFVPSCPTGMSAANTLNEDQGTQNHEWI